MRQKTIVGLIMAAGATLMVAVGGWVMALIVLVLICFGVQEEFHALAQAGHRPVAWPTWVGMIVSIPDKKSAAENLVKNRDFPDFKGLLDVCFRKSLLSKVL